jgi:hypothetical protein
MSPRHSPSIRHLLAHLPRLYLARWLVGSLLSPFILLCQVEEAKEMQEEVPVAAAGPAKENTESEATSLVTSARPASFTDSLSKAIGAGNPLWEGALSRLKASEGCSYAFEPALLLALAPCLYHSSNSSSPLESPHLLNPLPSFIKLRFMTPAAFPATSSPCCPAKGGKCGDSRVCCSAS